MSNHVRGMSYNMSVGLIGDEPSERISARPSGRRSQHPRPSDGAALTADTTKGAVGTVMQLLAMLDRLHDLHSKTMISALEKDLWSSWARTSIHNLLGDQPSGPVMSNGAGGSTYETG